MARHLCLMAIAAACFTLPASSLAQSATSAPRRLISLIPSVTDLIVALGAGDRLVARTAYDRDARLTALPSVGGTIDPDVERIVALHPDLVFTWRESAPLPLGLQLERAGLTVRVMGTETFEELRTTIDQLGRMLRVERQADSLRRAIDDTLAAVRATVAGRPPVRVLYLLGINPLVTSGPGTFVDDLITVAGGRNIFADLRASWASVSAEAVLERDPDVIVWPRPGSPPEAAAALRSQAGWSRLSAVRNGRVLIVDSDLFDRPGPRIGEAARRLAQGLWRAHAQ